MGGGLSNEFERLQPGIQQYINEWAMPGFKDIEVVRADLVQNSGLIGSAALAFLAQEKDSSDTPSKLTRRGHKG
jgi:glucokinase